MELFESEFASKAQLTTVAEIIHSELPAIRLKVKGRERGKAVAHIRAYGVSIAELVSTMDQLGYAQAALEKDQTGLTGKPGATTFNFVRSGSKITIILMPSGTVQRKEFTPVNLGLAGRKFNRDELITAVIEAVSTKVQDATLQKALVALIDIAVAGKGTLLPELNASIDAARGTISQDFGEILAPIMIMKPDDIAEFPVGNSPLVDVTVGDTNISVKSLTGSGTSFASISDLMDRFEAGMQADDPRRSKYSILKQFHPTSGGSNKDKIIRAAGAAVIPEYQMMLQTLGISQQVASWGQIHNWLISQDINDASYGEWLSGVYPIMVAGGWGRPTGLPADGQHYMANPNAPDLPQQKKAGKRAFDQNPAAAGADILTYVLGVGLLNYIRKGTDAPDYSQMMTDIVSQSNAVIGKIDITLDGSLRLVTRPFSELQFAFQYHAPSHIPGNNLPGFIALNV